MLALCADSWAILHTVHTKKSSPMVVYISQLDYTGAIGPLEVYYYSYTPLHSIHQLNCTGSESRILDCLHSSEATTSNPCSLNNDANVFCKGII